MVLAQGISAASDTSSTGDFPNELEGFLLSRQVEGCTPETCLTYFKRISQFFRFLNGRNPDLSINALSRTHIERYLLHLRELGRSPHYVHSTFGSLRAFFNWCVEEEFIPRSPMRNMKPPRLPKMGKPFISEATRDLLLSLCPPSTFLGARNAAIIWIFWSTGVRLEELVKLERADLDWGANRIRVFGKGAKERYVPFTKEAKKAVWRYLNYRKDDYPQLWLTEERRPAKRTGIQHVMRRLMERCGIQVKDLHHIFRRSWAMRNLKAGVPMKYVQLVGGWESVTTLEQYVRAMESEEALGAKWV